MIYMDYHATTPIDPRAREAMLPYLDHLFANAASATHQLGMKVNQAVFEARKTIAALIGATAEEIYFTSGATESVNTAIKGLYERESKRRSKIHMITQVTEHKAVLESFKYLERRGVQVTYLPVDSFGQISPEKLADAIRDETILISIMSANNEVGSFQPLEQVSKISREHHVFLHVDASQSIGKVPFSVEQTPIDLLSFTAHKMYGPKGIGALYVRNKDPHVSIEPLIHGGEQDNGLPGGTLNAPGIIGFGKVCEVAKEELSFELKSVQEKRDRLWAYIQKSLPDTKLNGHPEKRLPGNLNVSFLDIEAHGILLALGSYVALSSSSACSSANTAPSYVLKAMGLPKEYLYGSIRFGIGRFTTDDEIDRVGRLIVQEVLKQREKSPFFK